MVWYPFAFQFLLFPILSCFNFPPWSTSPSYKCPWAPSRTAIVRAGGSGSTLWVMLLYLCTYTFVEAKREYNSPPFPFAYFVIHFYFVFTITNGRTNVINGERKTMSMSSHCNDRIHLLFHLFSPSLRIKNIEVLRQRLSPSTGK